MSGEIDIASAPLLDDALRLAEGRAEGIILDLSGVEFIGSCGAQLVLETARRVRARGHHFTLDGASDVVTRLLDLMGVDDEFGLTAAPTEAARPDLHIVRSPTSSQ